MAQTVKNLPAMQETPVRSLGQKIPWSREWQPTPVFLPGESHGQRSLVGYSPWGRTTERLTHTISSLEESPSKARLVGAQEMCFARWKMTEQSLDDGSSCPPTPPLHPHLRVTKITFHKDLLTKALVKSAAFRVIQITLSCVTPR